MSAKQSMV